MKRLDQRGVAALEFCLIAVPLFTLFFAVVDFGRYAITMQSLRALADAGARANIIQCYTPAVIAGTTPSACTTDYLSATQKQAVAPFLFNSSLGLSPTVTTTAGTSALTVTASSPNFQMMMSVWGTSFNAPSASTQIPF
ncbi:TadE/TadG family type IV pilus assembly protein [Bradyrhizobium sp. CER78]|uniref:TadE/TadG family type IV pilus assembly protein n=1 Tax=Bradyrhizobium sp. CER78 TaxID=3039162 RepID=UPI0024485AA6|nr:TadE/TadG family type IV pilus assembly protein [Bradyrhizobium sp. CER78]MDH2379922.1 TadE/TadG family type IV pilus assembly protein [Bradyrhizobium sp. CER78]